MALGTNRDYKTRDQIFMKAVRKKGYLRLWACGNCGRKNLYKFDYCPRCGQEREAE